MVILARAGVPAPPDSPGNVSDPPPPPPGPEKPLELGFPQTPEEPAPDEDTD